MRSALVGTWGGDGDRVRDEGYHLIYLFLIEVETVLGREPGDSFFFFFHFSDIIKLDRKPL